MLSSSSSPWVIPLWLHLGAVVCVGLLFCSFVLLFITVFPSDASPRSGREGGGTQGCRAGTLGRPLASSPLALGTPIAVEPETRIWVQLVYLGRTPGLPTQC